MFDYQTAQVMITRLEAFKGRDIDECSSLIPALSEFVYKTHFLNLFEVNKLAEAILAVRPETTPMEIKPSVTAQLLADQIKPWIEDIRQTLFHSKSAPFTRVEDAEIWCDEAKKRIDEWGKRADEWRGRTDEWRRRRDEWEARWQAMHEKYPLIKESIETWAALRKQGIPVDLPTREEWQQLDRIELSLKSLEVGEPPKLDEQVKVYIALLDKILAIAKVTGFTWKSVRMHILVDAPPVLPPFTFSILKETHPLPSGTSFLNRFARVTIRGDLTFEELRSLYRSIRRELGTKRSKRPTTKHLQLYQMVRKRGGIPSRKGTVTFWKSVMREWNNLHPQDKYKTWKGVKLAYDRIIAQLERRITTKGGTP